MSTSVPVPTAFQRLVPSRSGLPPRSSIARVLNEQDMFLWAAKKYSVCYWLGRAQDAAEALGETEIPVGDPEEIRLMVPPYTRLARVMVLAQDADPDDFTYYQRVEVSGAADPETYRHRQEALSNGQTSLDQAVWWSSDAREPSADDLPDAVDCGPLSDLWREITVQVWLDSAQVHAVVFEFRRLAEVTL